MSDIMDAIAILTISEDGTVRFPGCDECGFVRVKDQILLLKEYGESVYLVEEERNGIVRARMTRGQTRNSAAPLCYWKGCAAVTKQERQTVPIKAVGPGDRIVLAKSIGGFGGFSADTLKHSELIPVTLRWDQEDDLIAIFTPIKEGWIWTEGHPFPHPKPYVGKREEAVASFERQKGERLGHRTKFFTFKGKEAPCPENFVDFATKFSSEE